MKSYYFISGLPRSGSTLLSAILKQNPNFYSDIASPIESIISKTIDLITSSENNLNIDEKQRKNTIYGIFNGYYDHIKMPVIFDSSRNWTKKTNFLKSLFDYTKILCPVRDIVDILNSFESISSKNSLYTSTLTNRNNSIFGRCDEMMDARGGVVSEPWMSLHEGYAANSNMIMIIEYNDLCKNPKKTMKKIYEFLEKPYYSHNFENIEYSNENFDKFCNLSGLHTVKNRIEFNPPNYILPLEIIKKYKTMNLEFWRENHKVDLDIIKNLDHKFINYQ